MADAIEEVRDRLVRATAALEASQVPYCVIGGNAVAEWVGSVDKSAVRFTKDVDILLRREDLEQAKSVMANAGFLYRHVKSIDMFLDGPGSKARDAVHVIFAGEKVRPDDLVASPTIEERKLVDKFHVVNFDA
ncbi:MAG TPA: nucleotidyltransferase family protein, partial [Gemmataceae bacterium]|nr:nucleotidyltransferase family protein [Gemmataceae bacterium]